MGIRGRDNRRPRSRRTVVRCRHEWQITVHLEHLGQVRDQAGDPKRGSERFWRPTRDDGINVTTAPKDALLGQVDVLPGESLGPPWTTQGLFFFSPRTFA
ncbi:hypothetical protein [Nonomuraea basaltis]|uniref:hypothetical protein n=1 Tax=Nonomuraea basaltis TaxID=2495887 RepID=UPI00110C641B|nr:hypothetical protein [Nonomuraea basaltis]TMR91062.1 hypothetical protein EJK15_51890 [Nonomuraea basaltis]